MFTSYMSEIDDHVYIVVWYTDYMEYKGEPSLEGFEGIESHFNDKKECTIYEFQFLFMLQIGCM
jgi:hypothetical protein